MGLRDAAKMFLEDTAGKLPEAADVAVLRAAGGRSWPDSARTLLANAGIRRLAGQSNETEKSIALVHDAVLDQAAVGLGISYYRLVAEYAGVCARMAPGERKKRLEELFMKLAKVPDTYTTATHFSRYHLMILEAAVLGLTEDCDF
jgi:hypothetical protein